MSTPDLSPEAETDRSPIRRAASSTGTSPVTDKGATGPGTCPGGACGLVDVGLRLDVRYLTNPLAVGADDEVVADHSEHDAIGAAEGGSSLVGSRRPRSS